MTGQIVFLSHTYRVVPREDDEAEVVLLGPDEDLPGLGQRPPRSPHRPHQRLGVDLVGRGHRAAPREGDLVVLVAVGDAPVALADAAGRVVVEEVAPPTPVPTLE